MIRIARIVCGALASASVLGVASAQLTDRVSIDSAGAEANGESDWSSVSGDGRFVAFNSAASNLVAGDTNGVRDVFVRDRQLGTTERVSVATGGAQANSFSQDQLITPDGRFVVFESFASNLVAGDTNGVSDIFLHDRALGTTERVSLTAGGAQGNAQSRFPTLSADGRFVAFYSSATNLVAGDTNFVVDVFVRDRLLATTERVSVATGGAQGNGASQECFLSADGRFVGFVSLATNLVAGDTNGFRDVFVHDRQLATTERVSVGSGGAQGDADSLYPWLSADGRQVAFYGVATTLVVGDTNGVADVFVRDRQLGTTVRASVGTGGAQGNAQSRYPALSSDGRFVVFGSSASNLVAGDTNATEDVFVHDLALVATERVSVASAGTQGNAGGGEFASLSDDGRFVAFSSLSSDLVAGDANGVRDSFVRDRGAPGIHPPFCSGDGTTATACPCANTGSAGRGCDNSIATGGAALAGTGSTSPDQVVLAASDMLPTALHIYLQGDQMVASGLVFGDGVRCAAGQLLRLVARNAAGGASQFPDPGFGDPSITARAAALGSPIAPGDVRWYQTYYRDPALAFCPAPPGNAWNVTNGVRVDWQ